MPKVKLSRLSESEYPPIDWLWAAVLERKAVRKMDLRQMAEVAGISYESMRQYAKKSPWEWPYKVRNNVCKALGVNIVVTPDGIRTEGGQ